MMVNGPTRTATSARGANGMPMLPAVGGSGIVMTFNDKEVDGNSLMGPAPPTVHWVPDVKLRWENLEDR